MLRVFEYRFSVTIICVLFAGTCSANSDSKIPMYYSSVENCADGSALPFHKTPNLFQKVDSLQLRTSTSKDIPKLSLAELISNVPLASESNLRGSIAGMDIQEQAKVYTDVFDRERSLKPDFVIEGLLGKDGSISNLSISKLRSSVKAIALRSKEAVNGNLSVAALDSDGAAVTEYRYSPYQIVYLKKDSGYEERFVDVSLETCSEHSYFVSRLGTKIIRHDRDTVPFRIFVPVSEPVKRLSVTFENNTFELAIPG